MAFLIDGLEGYGYRLGMDNYYNSVEMCRRLLRHKIHYASTLGVNRGEPKSIKDVTVSDLAVGKTSRHNEDIIVLAWRENRIVRMITTHHQDEMTVQVRQKKYPITPLSENLRRAQSLWSTCSKLPSSTPSSSTKKKNPQGRCRRMKRFILELVNTWTRLRTAGVEEEADSHPSDVSADAPPACTSHSSK